MLLIGGLVFVIVCVLGGYLMHGGDVLLLNQPAEFVIIGGAALGTLVVSTPMHVLKGIGGQVGALMSPPATRKDFTTLLAMLYQMFRQGQQGGIMSLESHIENPKQSPIFSQYPSLLKRHESLAFLADSVRVMIVGGISPHDFEALMTEDLEVRHKDQLQPSQALSKVGDALPGLGIVAAVLGIVITMQAIDGPPSEIGHKVGAALVGTFLGILLSYGFVGPVATAMEHRVHEEGYYDQCIKAGLLATYKGCAPAIAVEFSRRAIPEEVRPTFEQAEQACRGAREVPKAA
ncbi:MAG: flagellar motor stator protein MotA [Vicinamibacterales bacterium]|jgi:chemotaxis protein MotA